MKRLSVILLASSLVASCTGRDEPSPHGQSPPRGPSPAEQPADGNAPAAAQPPVGAPSADPRTEPIRVPMADRAAETRAGPVTGLPSAPASAPAAALYTSAFVIFVGPNSARMQRLKEEMGADFYVAADDENWYRAQAFTLLDSLGIAYRTVERGPMRFLVGGRERAYTWDDVRSAWFVVLYDGKGEPVVSHSIDLPTDIARLRGT